MNGPKKKSHPQGLFPIDGSFEIDDVIRILVVVSYAALAHVDLPIIQFG